MTELPRARQWRIVALGAGAAVLLMGVVWLAGRSANNREAASPVAVLPAGAFRATPQQLRAFTIEAVAVHGFVSEELTDGKIAVNADRTTPLYSPYSGHVVRVIAGPGDRVRQGEPLATLEAAEIIQGQGDLRTARAQLDLARINAARKQALYEARGGSLQDLQQAQTELEVAQTALESIRNRMRVLGQSPAQVTALETAPTLRPITLLRAPITGIVVDRQLGPGQFLQAGSGVPVFTIADTDSVWLLAQVRETVSGEIHVGQAVEVRVLAWPQRVYSARITHIAAAVDAITHRLTVRAEIDNHDGTLKPEMFASFRILTSDVAQSPAVPESAVVYDGEHAHVWVISGADLLEFRAVRVGRETQGVVEVLDGLHSGERIVTRGGLFIDQMAAPAAS